MQVVVAQAGVGADDQAKVQAWLDEAVNLREILRAGDGGARVDVAVEYRYVPPAAEIEALKRAVAGRPEHPQRAFLEGIERTLRGEFPVTTYAVWLWGRDFRCSMTREGERGLAFDSVSTAHAAWAMNRTALEIADKAASLGMGFNSVASFEVDLADAMFVLNAGLDEARQRGVVLRVAVAAPSRWSASGAAESEGGRVEINASGAWDEALGAGTVQQVEVKAFPGGAPSYITRYSAQGWRLEPALGRMVAGEAERRFGEQVDRRVRLVSAAKINREEFERATAVPALDGVDIIRGPVTYRAVVDHRAGRSGNFKVSEDRKAQAPVSGRTPLTARSDLRTIGWVLAGCVLVALVLLRIRGMRASG